MTFEEALKKLVEKYPTLFMYDQFRIFYVYIKGAYTEVDIDTQDGIDTVLAEIGWEYEVRFEGPHNGWSFNYWAIAVKDMWVNGISSFAGNGIAIFPTKLEAAKAALIAAVKKDCE